MDTLRRRAICDDLADHARARGLNAYRLQRAGVSVSTTTALLNPDRPPLSWRGIGQLQSHLGFRLVVAWDSAAE